ncbi:hypothetical protein J6590_028915 [Homalodisca vitripennis]|nr:hypothetical protein J6590_028915 [Homalodisca vitripennis]
MESNPTPPAFVGKFHEKIPLKHNIIGVIHLHKKGKETGQFAALTDLDKTLRLAALNVTCVLTLPALPDSELYTDWKSDTTVLQRAKAKSEPLLQESKPALFFLNANHILTSSDMYPAGTHMGSSQDEFGTEEIDGGNPVPEADSSDMKRQTSYRKFRNYGLVDSSIGKSKYVLDPFDAGPGRQFSYRLRDVTRASHSPGDDCWPLSLRYIPLCKIVRDVTRASHSPGDDCWPLSLRYIPLCKIVRDVTRASHSPGDDCWPLSLRYIPLCKIVRDVTRASHSLGDDCWPLSLRYIPLCKIVYIRLLKGEMSRGPAIVLAMTVGLCHCVVLDLGRNNRLEVNLPWLPFEGETRCYDELGCLNITRDWYHLIYRPFNVFPLPREVIDTRFVLYTRKNPVEGQTLKAGVDRTIQKSNFDAKKQTKLIVHGFIDTPLSNWVKEMRRELLKHSDWNVVVVDWAGGSLPLYTQATANTRLVGLEIAYFINYLSVMDDLFAIPLHSSSVFNRLFTVQACRLCNSLPDNIKIVEDRCSLWNDGQGLVAGCVGMLVLNFVPLKVRLIIVKILVQNKFFSKCIAPSQYARVTKFTSAGEPTLAGCARAGAADRMHPSPADAGRGPPSIDDAWRRDIIPAQCAESVNEDRHLAGSSTGGSVGDESPSCLRPDRDATFQGESRDPSLGVQSADIAKGAFQPVDCFKVGKQDSIQIEAVQRILVQ